MRRPVLAAVGGLEAFVLAVWFGNIRNETGVDSLLYHTMATAIVSRGYAPWIINPWSYTGFYPGSDSPGVPFLCAELTALSGVPAAAAIIFYNSVLLTSFGLGLFLACRLLTGRTDVGLLALLLGSFSYGFFSSILWNLDERAFNVALTPLFLFLVLPRTGGIRPGKLVPRGIATLFVAALMFFSHLSFLLLLPMLVLVPLMSLVVRKQFEWRRRTWASGAYFAMIAASPVAMLTLMKITGALGEADIQYWLAGSALFSGNSPFIFVLNAAVFVTTRAGPVSVACSAIGIAYLGTRRWLFVKPVLLGAVLLAGFVSLPLVLYSKDLLTPILVIPGGLGLALIADRLGKRRLVSFALATAVALGGSLAFDTWNSARSSASFETTYWTQQGITPEAANANAWIGFNAPRTACLFGNNWLATREVASDPGLFTCGDSDVSYLIRQTLVSPSALQSVEVFYIGVNAGPPQGWFDSPYLDQAAQDLASVPQSNLARGIAILEKYDVKTLVIALAKPSAVPGFLFEGVAFSPFFSQLWQNQYPTYESQDFAVFLIGPSR